MTDDELKELVANLAISLKETDKLQQENAAQMKETEKLQQETAAQMKETDKRQRENAAQITAQMKETAAQMKETDQRIKETEKLQRENATQIKALGRQIGGLGNKFGGFTEGMALPSMTRILRQQFGMEVVSPRVRMRKGGEEMEIDVLAYANSDINTVFIVEIKSRLLDKDVTQVTTMLNNFPRFFPEHAEKRLFGMIAAVDFTESEKQKTLKNGLYLAAITDEQFEIQTPPGFKAKRFGRT